MIPSFDLAFLREVARVVSGSSRTAILPNGTIKVTQTLRGLRQTEFVDPRSNSLLVATQQDPNKDSYWGRLAKRHDVVVFKKDNECIAICVDGAICPF